MADEGHADVTHETAHHSLGGHTDMARRTMLVARRVGATIIAAAIVGVLAGCTSDPPPPTPGEEVTAAATAFLMALSEGNEATALGMTTSSLDDFACASMVQDGLVGEIEDPVVTSVVVDGTHATAGISYSDSWADLNSPGIANLTTLSLEKSGDRWLVVLPETYRIDIEFDARVVAIATIERTFRHGEDSPTCDVRVRDARASFPAFPGIYLVTIEDPTGAVRYQDTTVHVNLVRVGGAELAPLKGTAQPEFSLNTTTRTIEDWLTSNIAKCTTIGEDRLAVCPPGTDGAVLLRADGMPGGVDDALGWWVVLDRVWTEDDETWLFSTEPVQATLSRDGVPFILDRSYTGHLEAGKNGYPKAVYDYESAS